MESKYLTFLDFGSQADIFRNVDDGTRMVQLPSTFSIGIYTFHTLFVRFNCNFCIILLLFDVDKLKWST